MLSTKATILSKINCKTSNVYIYAIVQCVYIAHKKYQMPTQNLWRKLNSMLVNYLSNENHMNVKRVKKLLISKCCHFVKKNVFSLSNTLMYMFNVYTLCMQSITCQQKNLWYKLNSPCMHYLTQTPYEEYSEKIC